MEQHDSQTEGNSLCEPQESSDLFGVVRANETCLPLISLAFRSLVTQQVAVISLFPFDLATLERTKSLGCSTTRFELLHWPIFLSLARLRALERSANVLNVYIYLISGTETNAFARAAEISRRGSTE